MEACPTGTWSYLGKCLVNRYLLCGQEHAEGEEGAFQALLAEHYRNYKGQQPKCLCMDIPVPLYIARIGDQYLLKRWPNSGSQHRYTCSRYEPGPEASGLGSLMGGAIVEEPHSGQTTLTVDFSLKKVKRRAADVVDTIGSDDVADESGKASVSCTRRLTLRSILHYLWDKSEFCRWAPGMQDRRSWGVIAHHLSTTAALTSIKSLPLSQILHIPPPWSQADSEKLRLRRQGFFSSFQSRSGPKRLVMVLGELKLIEPSPFGFRVQVKSMADTRIYMTEQKQAEFLRRFAFEVSTWEQSNDPAEKSKLSHLIVLFTAAVTESGALQVEDIAAMLVNTQWLPCFSFHDAMVVASAVALQRSFLKPMTYNLGRGRTLPSVILVDTRPLPINLFIKTPADSDVLNACREALIMQSRGYSYVWETSGADNVFDMIDALRASPEGKA